MSTENAQLPVIKTEQPPSAPEPIRPPLVRQDAIIGISSVKQEPEQSGAPVEEIPPANPISGPNQSTFWSAPQEQGAVGIQSSAHGGARPKGQGNRQYPGDKGSGKPPPGDVVCKACETMQCSLSTIHSIHQCTCCVFKYCCVQCLDVSCRRCLRHFDL